MHKLINWAAMLSAVFFVGCSSKQPMQTVPYVDLDRFMGNWFVIANIPTFIEKGAHNAIENYQLNADNEIETTFTFHADAHDGPLKTYKPKGFVTNTDTNATWGMQFIWLIKADYRIVHLDEAYQQTIIARQARDYVWIMARTPQLDDATYDALLSKVAELGYDTSSVLKVPQHWPDGAPIDK